MDESRYKSIALCARFEGELEAYLEGEARPFVASHSQGCAACRTLLADLRSIRVAAQELPQEDPSPTAWRKVRASLEAEGILRAPACLRFEDELAAYMEGEAQPFVASHSQACSSCGALLADLQATRIGAQELPQEGPSQAVWTHVLAALEADGLVRTPACARFESELEAYMEGEARPFIATHALACRACNALVADLEAIRLAARELPQEEPSRVVWANVRATLEAEGALGAPVSGWRQLLSWRLLPHAIPVGVLAALVFLGTVLTLPYHDVQQWNASNEAAGAPAVAEITAVTPTGEDGTIGNVVSDLETSFRANEASMTPDLKATYEKSLVSLDGSIKECLDSLRHEPRNALAHEYLLTAYTRKAEILSSALEFQGR